MVTVLTMFRYNNIIKAVKWIKIYRRGDIWFLASCVEFYKDEKGMNGREAYNYLRETGALSFIIGCWEGLHTTCPSYVIESIDEYIKTHTNSMYES